MFKGIKNISLKACSALLLTALFFTACASSTARTKSGTTVKWDSSIKKGELDNGMTYFIKKNAYPENRISLRLVVKAGSAMEDDDQKGIAHLVEHMAFNGTQHFEKSAIVDFFEKNGMKFGGDLNAYTSFEETVYKLEIPADDPEILETAVLILHDWASAVSFQEEEINKERGVVIEEWRLRDANLSGRVNNKQLEILLKDSRFIDRLPIGDLEIIKNISRERIVDFYEKWYRPEFMSVVAVGDIEEDKLQEVITRTMSKIPASSNTLKLPKYTIPVQKEKSLDIMKDPEQPYLFIYFFKPDKDFRIRNTEEDIKQFLTKRIASTIVNNRFSEITNSPDSPWLDASTSSGNLTNWFSIDFFGVIPKSSMTETALKKAFDEIDKLVDFGITESELNRLIEVELSQVELDYQNKDKIYNYNHASKLVDYSLTGLIPISPEDERNLCKKFIPNITIENVNEEIRKLFDTRGTQMLIISPEKEDLPDTSILYKLWNEYKNPELTAYKDDVTDSNLMARPSKKAKIVSKTKNANLGVNEYVLSNGIKIITKKTDFKTKYMYMQAYSKGGYYLLDRKDIDSLPLSGSYMINSGFGDISFNQLIKKIQTKSISLNFDITNTNEYISADCKSSDSETIFQLTNLMFTKAQFTDDSWKNVYESYKAQAEAYGSLPEDYFNAKINEILYGKDDIYHKPRDTKWFENVNKESAQRIFLQRFKNPADFTFVFAGDFNENKLLENCCYYLGTLETSEDREETKYQYWDFPKDIQTATVHKGIGDKGSVYIAFGGTLPEEKDIDLSYKDSFLLKQVEALLGIRLREVIREDKSGSYGIVINSYIDGAPERYHRTSISFGCEPGRCNELTQEIINEINRLKTEAIDSIYLDKLKENLRRSRETNLKNNGWWISRINAALVFNYEPQWLVNDVERLVDLVTEENLKDTLNKYFNTENYVSVFLVPENK